MSQTLYVVAARDLPTSFAGPLCVRCARLLCIARDGAFTWLRAHGRATMGGARALFLFGLAAVLLDHRRRGRVFLGGASKPSWQSACATYNQYCAWDWRNAANVFGLAQKTSVAVELWSQASPCTLARDPKIVLAHSCG